MTVIHAVIEDEIVRAFLFALILDFALGTLAALKDGTFQIGYLPRVLRDDLLLKGVPLLILSGASAAAPDLQIVIPGLDPNALKLAAFGLTIAGLGTSILKSLRDLYPGIPVPDSKLLGGDQTGPR